ncbi:unnamed protein product [Paramecium octaurelia]|uniref:Trichocyst matrix protein n=1 Tax=Paramecium octaurelia TaxID=43137 RepID=A0A8S1ST56_PAROT|nr:unnamed protein product [Paramecium octaurelia]
MRLLIGLAFITIIFCQQQHKFNPEFLNLISTGTGLGTARDAIQAVLQLLEDLKNANEELDRKADKAFQEYEGGVLNDCAAFTGIMKENNESLQKNSEDLEAVDDKIAQTTDYLNWNEKRRKSNDMKLEDLAEQRCEANSLFIDALRDYREALNVLEWVNGDLQLKEQNAFLQKEEAQEYTSKLSLYTNMIDHKEVFSQVEVSQEDQAAQVVSEIVGKVQGLISKIQEHIKTLEEQEITSANDFVDYRRNLLNEQVLLKQEYDSRLKFLNSLEDDKELAQDVVSQCEKILGNTQRILQQTQNAYNQQKAKYVMEKQKRHEENQIIIEIMMLYHQKIAQAEEFLQKKGV